MATPSRPEMVTEGGSVAVVVDVVTLSVVVVLAVVLELVVELGDVDLLVSGAGRKTFFRFPEIYL